MKRTILSFKFIVLAISFFVFLIVLYTIFCKAILKEPLPTIGKYGLSIVGSDSMCPSVKRGDVLLIKSVDIYQQGDIIVYKHNNSLISHRIIEIDKNYIILKGDSNSFQDYNVDLSSVKGKVIYIFPKIGFLIMSFKSPSGVILFTIISFVLIEVLHYIEKNPKK